MLRDAVPRLMALLAAVAISALPAVAQTAGSDPRIEGARKEGQLNWIDAIVVPATASKFEQAFRKRYGLPNFKINHVRYDTGKVASTVAEEVRADRVNFDILGVASPRLFISLKSAGALAQYDSPEYKYFLEPNKAAGLDFEPGYWMSAIAYTYAVVANPKFYEKPIESWYDLLDPALKGHKIDWPHAASSDAALYHYFGLRKVLPREYFEKLKQQDPAFGISSVQKTANLETGEILVSATTSSRMYQNWKQTGVALKAYFPKEGSPLFGHSYGILAKAPHPNAARLFVDFLFSEEGQKLYQEQEGIISARAGLPVPDDIKNYSPQLSSIATIPMDWKNITDQQLNAALQEFTQIFGAN